MKKRILTTMNVLLGAMSVGLVGCHVGKNATNPAQRPMLLYGVPTERMMAKYGVPVRPVDELQLPADTIDAPADTTAISEPQEVPEQTPAPKPEMRPVVKYGIPNNLR